MQSVTPTNYLKAYIVLWFGGQLKIFHFVENLHCKLDCFVCGRGL